MAESHEEKPQQACQTLSDDGAATDLASKIKDCPLAMMRGDPAGLLMYLFDSKTYGESQQRPEIRPPPFREGPYNRLVQTVLQVRQSKMYAAELGEPLEATLGNGEFSVSLDAPKRQLGFL